MRKIVRAAVAAGALTAMVLGGAGVAGADGGAVPKGLLENNGGAAEASLGRATNFGYGSLGTELVVAPLSAALNFGFVTLSVDLPNLTGLNSILGSTGSYAGTPFYGSAQTLMGSTASLGGVGEQTKTVPDEATTPAQ